MIVYKITNKVNQKVYIGVTRNKLQQRWIRHLNDCNCGKDYYLYRAMRKYGIINFSIEVIDTTDSLEKLAELEKHYIKTYNSLDPNFGYNSIEGNYGRDYITSGKSKITKKDIYFIRNKYKEGKLRCIECYKMFYSEILSYSGFQKIWEGTSWQHIMPEVYTKENIELHKKQLGHKGENNINSLLTDNEILEIRKYYVNHTRQECFDKFGINVYTSKQAFFNILSRRCFKHLPCYLKNKKQWYLYENVIDINNYKPVSTISESGE